MTTFLEKIRHLNDLVLQLNDMGAFEKLYHEDLEI